MSDPNPISADLNGPHPTIKQVFAELCDCRRHWRAEVLLRRKLEADLRTTFNWAVVGWVGFVLMLAWGLMETWR